MSPRPRAARRPAVPDLSGYWTATDAARYLGITLERVRQLAARADHPIPNTPTPLGRLFHPDDVAAWQAEREAAGHLATRTTTDRRPQNAAPVEHLERRRRRA